MRRLSVIIASAALCGLLIPLAPLPAAAASSSSPVVVVIDSTGFDTTNPALAGHVVAEVCLDALGGQSWEQAFCPGHASAVTGAGVAVPQTSGGSYVFPSSEHGTAVASEVLNVDPSAQLIVIRSLYSFTNALSWVYQHRGSYNLAAVVYSMAGPLNDPSVRGWVPCDQATESVAGRQIVDKPFIDSLAQAGVPVVIAAGNDGNAEYLAFPACVSSAVSVGASDGSTVASYSNVSTQISVLAPGTATVANETAPGQFVDGSLSGTSIAAPYVGGVFALARAAFPGTPYQVVLAAMRASGTLVNDQAVRGLPIVSPSATLALLAAGSVPSLSSTFSTQVLVAPQSSPAAQPAQQLNAALARDAALQKRVTALLKQIAALRRRTTAARRAKG